MWKRNIDHDKKLFRGYVEIGQGKKPLNKFKGDVPLLTLEDAVKKKGYAGVLAQDTVLIDIDDKYQGEVVFKMVEELEVLCRVVETTRGYHFFFKNDGSFDKCRTKANLAIGVTADIKIGKTNSLAIIKHEQKNRKIVYDILEDEEYDVVPKWLHVVNTTIRIWDLGEGDGRNDSLFKYILPLINNGFSKQECREVIELINNYILKTKLSATELKTILRDEAFAKKIVPIFFKDKQFLFDEFSKYLINELHIKRINGLLHTFSNGIYVDGEKNIEREMLKLIPNLSQSKRKEVLAYLDVIVESYNDLADANLIAFNNGILNIETMELLDFDPKYIITNKINYDFNENAQCELLDHTLDRLACNDATVRRLLEEMAGYCFYRRNELRKAFILLGEKSNGKSTYISMIQKMIGEENCANLDMKELGERFKTAELFRKLVNLGDDIDDNFINDTAVFKKLVSGDRLTAEKKGKDPFEFTNYSKFIFSANVLPRVKDKTGAVLDRLIIIPFNATFSKDDPDYRPYIKYELCEKESIEYLIKLGVKALRRVLKDKKFSTNEKLQTQLEIYNEINNPILGFFKEVEITNREPIDYWYGKYHEFCLSNNLQTASKIEFSRQVLRKYPNCKIIRKRIDKKEYRFYEF